jgi:selenocysteine lyase/cysteine desulfurase
MLPIGQEQAADPLGVRKDFAATSEYTCLNTAHMGLLPRPVVDAGRAWLDARARNAVELDDMLAKTDEVRSRFARLIKAADEEIGLLFSTTEGENLVVDALDFKSGDNIVIDDLVFPSTPVIDRRLEETKGVELRIARHRDGAVQVEDFERLVDTKTRLVSVAWVSNLNGFRHDMRRLADLAHTHGAYLYADAVQAVGMGPVDVREADVDFLCSGSYKWLLAGFGIAPFFVRQELLDRIRPDRAGWHVAKYLGNYRYEPYRDGRKYMFSCLAFGEAYQLAAALAYLEQIGLARIEQHTLALTQQLRKGLVERGFRIFTPDGTRSSILSFFIKRPPADAAKLLEAARVKVSVENGDRTDDGSGSYVRVSLSLFNNAGDIQRMLDVSDRLRV